MKAPAYRENTRRENREAPGRYRGGFSYVIDGNTVRVVAPADEAVPARRERPVRPERTVRPERPVRPSGPQRPGRSVSRPSTGIQEERGISIALSISRPLLVFLVAAVIGSMIYFVGFLNLRYSVDYHMDRVKQLESQLEKLRTENDALEQSIDISVDLNYVYAVATQKLGMVRAGNDNIINYDKTESEYVRQYEEIGSDR